MKKFANLYLAIVFLILYLPIFYLIAYAFNAGDDMNKFTGFDLVHFQKLFEDSRLILILAQTFFLAFLSSLIATIIGTFGAIYIYQARKKYQDAFLSINNILMVAPDVMIGASFLILFTTAKFQLGFVSVLASHVAFSIPIVVLMILPIFNVLDDLDPNLINASRDLGANRWDTFRRVIFPLSMNGVRSGVQSVFIPSLSLFMLTRLIGGNRVITLGTAIEQHFLTTQNWGMGSTIGVVLIIAMLLIMWATKERRDR